MKSISVFFLFNLMLFITSICCAQKQTFDVVSYSTPKGWQKTENEGGIQLSVTDKKTGGYAIALITKSRATNASAKDNFNDSWESLVKKTVQVTEAPTMSDMLVEKGWDAITGQANYTDGKVKGLVTLITATGNGKMADVVIMTNTSIYQEEVLAFLNSLELNETATQQSNTINTSANTNSGSLVGVWSANLLETSGYANGYPQYTAGYFRKEYQLNADGTYLFLFKTWSVFMKTILFGYETGTWSATGNQLTITPKQGKSEEWSKSASGRTTEWGARIKSGTGKLETITYRYETKYYSGSKDYVLILNFDKSTGREGTEQKQATYTKRTEHLIDLPPGTKINSEGKPEALQQNNSKQTTNNNSSPLVGKTWEGSSSEKMGSGNMQMNTGGFFTKQYQFNTDGTYRFVNVLASHFTDTKTMGYETGTWAVNGNQLTINPTSGQNEEWSKVGKTSNGNSDVGNRAINDTWSKKLKTSTRKLEKYTYTFSVEKNGDNTALIMERNGKTERDGDGKISYLNETPSEKGVKLPNGIK
ncbi:hypothetical protein CPT03_10765 [Pedobacter ginsengisoli]|uniref:Lipocalin-like domain-containing protein n=1 Tax=Pedobacter ginsengisoli TaxID=363852 RepID=A0A2D1U5R0_9SPHI|nr:lipocalin family protein [Pedobacter ginsengisoli]ATP56927.1 hypothetical protein CPT03_10765 [Pedobacter ginsengisoli]